MSDQPPSHHPPVDHQPDEVAKLTKLAEDHLNGWKRAKADYLNLKKQTDKEKEEIAQFAQVAAIMQFVPVYESFRRAWDHVPTEQRDAKWVQGFEHIQKQFADIFKKIGLEPIAPEPGQAFDPAKHHAISKAKNATHSDGQIVDIIKLGWRLGDRVLEPAQVTVAE